MDDNTLFISSPDHRSDDGLRRPQGRVLPTHERTPGMDPFEDPRAEWKRPSQLPRRYPTVAPRLQTVQNC